MHVGWSTSPSASHLPSVRPDEGPVGAVHLVVKAAGVAQVVSRAVPAPQRRGHGAAVHTLPALRAHVVNQVWGETQGGHRVVEEFLLMCIFLWVGDTEQRVMD